MVWNITSILLGLFVFPVHCDVTEPTNITSKIEWIQNPCSPDYMHYFQQVSIICMIELIYLIYCI